MVILDYHEFHKKCHVGTSIDHRESVLVYEVYRELAMNNIIEPEPFDKKLCKFRVKFLRILYEGNVIIYELKTLPNTIKRFYWSGILGSFCIDVEGGSVVEKIDNLLYILTLVRAQADTLLEFEKEGTSYIYIQRGTRIIDFVDGIFFAKDEEIARRLFRRAKDTDELVIVLSGFSKDKTYGEIVTKELEVASVFIGAIDYLRISRTLLGRYGYFPSREHIHEVPEYIQQERERAVMWSESALEEAKKEKAISQLMTTDLGWFKREIIEEILHDVPADVISHEIIGNMGAIICIAVIVRAKLKLRVPNFQKVIENIIKASKGEDFDPSGFEEVFERTGDFERWAKGDVGKAFLGLSPSGKKYNLFEQEREEYNCRRYIDRYRRKK